jgi:hypothetical protein
VVPICRMAMRLKSAEALVGLGGGGGRILRTRLHGCRLVGFHLRPREVSATEMAWALHAHPSRVIAINQKRRLFEPSPALIVNPPHLPFQPTWLNNRVAR